jgi:hypothetical protein
LINQEENEMRKQMRKLTLSRETLLRLERSELGRVRGGQIAQIAPDSGEDTCGLCNSVASCTELKEDCCVTTRV